MNCLDTKNKTYYKKIFYFAMAAFILLFFISLFVTHGESMRGVLFWNGQDTFMDHFNSVIYNAVDPYENDVIYPPLSTLTYRLLYQIIPVDAFNSLITDPTELLQPPEMKIYHQFTFGFVLLVLFTSIVFFYAINELKQGTKAEKVLFTSVICFSAPVLFMIDRGNNIAVPLALSILYLALYRSENKVAKEIALIALGMATGFKLYPVAFGALLVREKKYKEFVRAAIYCILFTIVPFFIFYDGFDSIMLLIGNISGNSTTRGLNDADQLGFSKMLIYPLNVLRIRVTDLAASGKFFNYFVTAASVISVFFIKKRWKAVLLCACIIYGFQDICVSYMLTFLILPLTLMLDEETENKPINYIYLICFILMFAPVPFKIPSTDVWTRYAIEKISSYAVGLATGLAVIEAFGDIFSEIEKKLGISKLKSAITTVTATVIFIFTEVFINPGAWFDIGIGISSDSGSADILKTVISFVITAGAWFAVMFYFHKKSSSLCPEGKEAKTDI